ncbi:hypothetical protein ACFVZ8_36815, partial [Streptomyces sp. NPDC059558]
MGGQVDRSRGNAVLRACGCAAAGLFLIAGCTADGSPKDGAASRTPAASGTPSGPSGAGAGTAAAPSGGSGSELVPELDESKQPNTVAEGRPPPRAR